QRERSRLRVIIARVGKTERRRDEAIVILFNAVDVADTGYIVEIGKKFLLPPDAVLQSPEKILLVNPITRQGHVGRAGAQINGRRNCADAQHFDWRIVSIFTRELENHVTA